MSALTLTRVTDFRTVLGVTDGSEDAKLTLFLSALEAYWKAETGNPIVSATVTEYLDGDGTDWLLLKKTSSRRPISSFTTLKEKSTGAGGQGAGDFSTGATTWALGTDFVYMAEVGQLRAIKRNFAAGILNFEAVYVAGYTNVPDDVPQALYTLGARVRKAMENGGATISEETLGRYSYKLMADSADDAQLAQVRRTFQNYTDTP